MFANVYYVSFYGSSGIRGRPSNYSGVCRGGGVKENKVRTPLRNIYLKIDQYQVESGKHDFKNIKMTAYYVIFCT